jgi:AcrR family transcriptional regulator
MIDVINNNLPPRRRGRPPAFDRDEVLERAGRTFWRLGYEGASIADLTAAMGLTPQSLYAAFHSKADLYQEALRQYLAASGAFVSRALDEEPTAAKAFDRALREAARQYTRPDQPRGCMISTAVVTCAIENDAVAAQVASLRADILATFKARLQRGVREGDLKPGTNAAELARYLQVVIQGMSLQAKDGASHADLQKIAAIACAELERHCTSPSSSGPRERE